MKVLTQQFWSDSLSNIKALWRGGQELAENASLIAVSSFTFYIVLNLDVVGTWIERGLLTAASVIALRALAELGKDLVSIARARAETTAPAKRYAVQRART